MAAQAQVARTIERASHAVADALRTRSATGLAKVEAQLREVATSEPELWRSALTSLADVCRATREIDQFRGLAAPTPVTATPLWEPTGTDPDLAEATRNDPSLAAWMEALASLSAATMSDNVEEQLYGQAPDALTRQGIAPSPEAIEDWVTRHLHGDS